MTNHFYLNSQLRYICHENKFMLVYMNNLQKMDFLQVIYFFCSVVTT
jgi:hypothetical protein